MKIICLIFGAMIGSGLWGAGTSFLESFLRETPSRVPAALLPLYRLSPAIMVFVLVAAAGAIYQSRRRRFLDVDPASLKGSDLSASIKRVRGITYFTGKGRPAFFLIIPSAILFALVLGNNPAGYLVLVSAYIIFGLLSGICLAGGGKKLLLRSLLWLGKANLKARDWKELEAVLDRLRQAGEKSIEAFWLEANLALSKGDNRKAGRILMRMPRSAEVDRLLLEILARTGDYQAIEKRLTNYNPESALTMIQSLPSSADRNSMLFGILVRQGKWKKVASLLDPMGVDEALALLRHLPSSPQRDEQILRVILKSEFADKTEQILQVLGGYSTEQGMSMLGRLLPPGQECDRLAVALLHGKREYGRIRELVKDFSTTGAMSLLEEMPPCRERDLLMLEVWVRSGNEEAVLDFFKDQGPEQAVAMLRAMEPGLSRDLVLSSFFEQSEQHGGVVACLEPHRVEGSLPLPGLKRLARGYAKSGMLDQALPAFEDVFGRDLSDGESLTELCRVCIALDRQSDAITRLDSTLDLRLLEKQYHADAMWALVEYYRHFNENDKARMVAESASSVWQDPRASSYLASLLEQEGRFRKAAQHYTGMGVEGILSQALCMFRSEDYEGAIPLLEKIENEADKSVVHYHLGYAFYRTGDLERAVEYIEKADPERRDPLLRRDLMVLSAKLGGAAVEKGKHEEAAGFFHRALELGGVGDKELTEKISDALSGCYYFMARKLVLDPDADADPALALIKKARSHHARPWAELDFLLALNLLKDKNTDRALAALTELAARNPQNRSLLFHRALAAAMNGKYDEAGRMLDKLVSGPADSYGQRAVVLLGSIALRQGDMMTAERHLRSVISGPAGVGG